MKTSNFTSGGKHFFFFVILLHFYFLSGAQITEIYTDYGGYWKSTTTNINTTVPNNSHNVLAFNYNSVIYSTGVNDALLTTKGVIYTSSNFKALPVTSIGGTITSGTSTYIALGTLYDGVANGYSTPLPSLRINDVLTDGTNGLNIGTGVTNIPATASINFPISNINSLAISDSKPDILFSQTAQPTGAGDKLYFVNSSGVIVGDTVSVTWSTVSVLGNYVCDLYTLSYTSCDAAVITGGSSLNQSKEIRLVALQLSQFNLNATSSTAVTRLVIKPGGMSDPAFVAYNSDAFGIPSPVITVQPQTQVICPGAGNSVTFSVTATGTGLSYQWKKNGVAISGATSSSYTISNVSAADAGTFEVAVTNSGGTVTSSIAYLNTVISVQPSPSSQTLATGNSVTLSVSATNATGYQWQRNGVNISGATSSSYTINPLTTSNSGSFQVSVINSASGSCATVLSNAVTVTAATTLYSKSTGNLNVGSNWGVVADGSGSTPVNFTRSEHTFKVSNRMTASTGGDLTIAGTLDLADAVTTITPASTLNAAQIIRSGTTGTLTGSSTSNLTVGGTSNLYFTTGSSIVKNLTISGGITLLNTPLSITAGAVPGVVTVTAGTLTTSGNLTLKSDASGTATVGTSAGTISGTVIIERYMPARRAWRLMTAPVSATNAPTIKASWQEGAAYSTVNLNPGYGTHITGGSVANGFDQSPRNNASVKYFNNGAWVSIPNTNATAVNAYPGYMFFVRGNRAYDINSTTQYITATSTVLRVTGNLNQGTQAGKTVNASGFTMIANPYASPVDFSLIVAASTNLKNRVRVWDPSLSGTNGVGGYVTIDWNGSAYTNTPSSSMSSIIQPGQAFFVESNNGTTSGSLVINEGCKSGSTTTLPFARPVKNVQPTIALNLKVFNPDSSTSISDGALFYYDTKYSGEVDKDDAEKIKNFTENISIESNGRLLSIERRPLPAAYDTLKLNLTGLKTTSYELEVSTDNFANLNLAASLYDTYIDSLIPLEKAGTITYSFAISEDVFSKSTERFAIVFKPSAKLPVSFHSLNGQIKYEKIFLNWKVKNEPGIRVFKVEKLVNNKLYEVASISAKGGGSSIEYSFTDTNILSGDNFYRIKGLDVNAHELYNDVTKVTYKKAINEVTVSSMQKGLLKIKFNDFPAGLYTITVNNNMGQVLFTRKIHHQTEATELIQLNKYMAKGIYNVNIITPQNNLVTNKIFL